jgi:hypothetical protein
MPVIRKFLKASKGETGKEVLGETLGRVDLRPKPKSSTD